MYSVRIEAGIASVVASNVALDAAASVVAFVTLAFEAEIASHAKTGHYQAIAN